MSTSINHSEEVAEDADSAPQKPFYKNVFSWIAILGVLASIAVFVGYRTHEYNTYMKETWNQPHYADWDVSVDRWTKICGSDDLSKTLGVKDDNEFPLGYDPYRKNIVMSGGIYYCANKKTAPYDFSDIVSVKVGENTPHLTREAVSKEFSKGAQLYDYGIQCEKDGDHAYWANYDNAGLQVLCFTAMGDFDRGTSSVTVGTN